MRDHVSFEYDSGVALLKMDDGRVNALSSPMIEALGDAFERAERAGAVVILTGREEVFSAGFDLGVMSAGGLPALRMIRSGFELAARILSFPYPVIAACNGHAVAMGAFLVLAADYRIGAAGSHRLQANEVVMGITMPRAAVAILRHRLTPAHFVCATLLSESYSPERAVQAGFLDDVVAARDMLEVARERAQRFAELDTRAHARSKRRIRASTVNAIRRGLSADLRELALLGVRRRVRSEVGRIRRRFSSAG